MIFEVKPSWSLLDESRVHHLSKNEQSWLLEPDSLTTRLADQYGSTFSVELIQQGYEKLPAHESSTLNIDLLTPVLTRYVVLWGQNLPLICARTVFDRGSVELEEMITSLGSNSLGNLLFRRAGVSHGALEYAQIQSDMAWLRPFSKHNLGANRVFHARRCLHKTSLASILVNEIYLPAIFSGAASVHPQAI